MFQINKVLKDFEFAITNPVKIKDPKALSHFCKTAKIAQVALAIVTLAIGLFSGPLGFLFTAPLAIALYDGYKVTNNIEEIADKITASKYIPKPKSPQEHMKTIGRGTIIAKPLMGLFPNKSFA